MADPSTNPGDVPPPPEPGQLGELPPPPDETVEINDEEQHEEQQLTNESDAAKAVQSEIENTGTFWSPPDFGHQSGALGWASDAYNIPPGFLRRVNFWIDIYTKYTTDQV